MRKYNDKSYMYDIFKLFQNISRYWGESGSVTDLHTVGLRVKGQDVPMCRAMDRPMADQRE